MECYTSARNIPANWDSMSGDNLYMKRNFLSFIEQSDPCEQKYYIFRKCNKKIAAILVTYTRHNFNLLMFTPFKISLKMTFIYVPLSVTRPGIVCGEECREEVASFLRNIKGYKLILNTYQELQLCGFTQAFTFPKCLLKIQWRTFSDYLKSLRSSYRYRYNKALKKSKDLKYFMLDDNKKFDLKLYALYEQVYNKSPYKIEKLPIEFFQGTFFKIFVFEKDDVPVGFIQLLENGRELIFEFVGFEHKLNHDYDIYISLLLKIIEYGIKNKFKIIDFGQTADEAKLKLGCKYEKLYALIHHSNPLINWLTGKFVKFIQYNPLNDSKFHVFNAKED